MNHLYLLIDIFSVVLPLLFTFYPTIRFYREWRAIIPALLIPAIFFILWDMLYTKLQVWGFNPRYISGTYIGNLPLEEIMFFLCIPFACLFTYFSLQKFLLKKNNKASYFWCMVPAIICWIVAFIYRDRFYTVATFMLLGLSFLYASYAFRDKIITFFKCYLILLVPFFIVNGILTGTGIDGVVVWYNEAHIIGIRIFTIPIEDIFYGMLLVFWNVLLFEKTRIRFGIKL